MFLLDLGTRASLMTFVSSISVGWWEETKWDKVIYSRANMGCKEKCD